MERATLLGVVQQQIVIVRVAERDAYIPTFGGVRNRGFNANEVARHIDGGGGLSSRPFGPTDLILAVFLVHTVENAGYPLVHTLLYRIVCSLARSQSINYQ